MLPLNVVITTSTQATPLVPAKHPASYTSGVPDKAPAMLPKLPHSLLCALALLAVAAPSAFAQTTFNVPSTQYPHIQDAINAAASTGDTIVVAAGTYYENLDFQSKTLTLTGPTVSEGTAPTAILDGQFKGPAISLTSGSKFGQNSTIQNLQIQHGGSFASFYPVYAPAKGAIFMSSANPAIVNNTIVDSACFGIDVEASSAGILDNTISGTEGGQCYYGGGSAIYISGDRLLPSGGYAHSSVIHNTIENNIQSGLDSSDGIDGGGAGIAVAGSSLILNNTIRNNNSNGSAGGGIDVIDGTNLTIAQNLIYGNTGCGGGGIALPPSGIGPRLVALITNNTIVDNLDSTKGCTPSTQLYEFAADAAYDGPELVIVNNILSGPTTNPPTTDAAFNCALPVDAAPSEATQPIFDHNILNNPDANFFGQYCIDVSAKYGNIAADPDFVDRAVADFSLNAGSPAIDAGNNSALVLYQQFNGASLVSDINSNVRLQETKGANYPIIDIGAYEYTGVNSLPSPTTIVLTSSAYTGHPGYTYTLTANIQADSTTPTGKVTFYLDGAQIGDPAPINGGVATLSGFLMPPGVHSLYASYPGDGNASPAVSIINIVDITLISTTVTLQYCPLVNGACQYAANTPVVNQLVQFTVNSSSADGTVPSPINISDVTDPNNPIPLDTVLPTTQSMGMAMFDTSRLSVGTHQIKAEFLGDLTHAEASETIQVIIYGVTTTMTLSCGPNATVPLGSTIPLLATVTSADGIPSGNVGFTQGKTTLDSVALSGTGTASFNATAVQGFNSFVATFKQQNGYGSSSASCNVNVQSLSLASSANPAPAFAPITFTATNATVPTPTGTYSLTIGTNAPVAMTVSGGTATYTTAGLAPGSYNVFVTFKPSDGTASYTAPLTLGPQVVSPATGDFTLTGPATLTTSTGGSAKGTLSLGSIEGFSGTVALTCNLPLPTTYSCIITPNSVPLAVNGTGSATVVLAPNNTHASVLPRPGRSRIVLASLLPLTLLSLLGLARRRKGLRGLVCLAILASLASATTACGNDVFTAATQPGAYPFTVTGTGTTMGGTAPSTHTLNITLNIAP
jgi:hypothetical protein